MRKHLALCVLLAVPAAFAQGPTTNPAASDNGALEQKIRDLEDRIIALEGQVRLLKSQPGSAAPAVGAASTQPAGHLDVMLQRAVAERPGDGLSQ